MKFITYDVEHGSCHVLRVPNQNEDVFMFDAGSKEDFSPALHLKDAWGISSLRWLAISHLDSDHITDISNVDLICPNDCPVALDYPKVSDEILLASHGGEIPATIEVFKEFSKRFVRPVPDIDDPGYFWGGVKFARFKNNEEDFDDINNLSQVTFIDYVGTTILLPGDLEKPGWMKLLEKPDFIDWLQSTDILVASHHGRDSGFCSEVFDNETGKCKPIITIFSDKSIVDSSVPEKYRAVTQGMWCTKGDGSRYPRRVLTTRSDGAILVDVSSSGVLNVKYGFDYSTE